MNLFAEPILVSSVTTIAFLVSLAMVPVSRASHLAGCDSAKGIEECAHNPMPSLFGGDYLEQQQDRGGFLKRHYSGSNK